ncbi:MAG TPA: DUF2846 domain-containing protein [Rhizomicrobium sp.]|jgi:hypothetical protein|nr:DUF2846 domain-containing protein [Rhizomicrobium sp.]
MKRYVVLALGLLAGGCVDVNAPLYVAAPPAPDHKAVLYIYRVSGLAGATGNAAFVIDGVPLVHLPMQGYTYVYLSPGHHVVDQSWPVIGNLTLTRGTSLGVDVAADQSYYIRFSTAWGLAAGYTLSSTSWQMDQVRPPEATGDLATMHFAPADPSTAGKF